MVTKLEPRNLVKLPPELITALGEVSARYGQIEHVLTMTIHRTEELPYAAAFEKVEELKGQKEIRKEVEKLFKQWAIKEFGPVAGADRAKSFKDLLGNWTKLANDRHDVIHCCWSVGIKDKALSGTRKGELLVKEGLPIGITDIQRLGENLKQFLVLLNKATKPGRLSGSEQDIGALPEKFTPDYSLPVSIETNSTAATTLTVSPPTTTEND